MVRRRTTTSTSDRGRRKASGADPVQVVDGVREFGTVLNGPVDPASAERLRLLPALDMSGAGGGLHLRCIVEAPAPRLRG